MAGTGDNPNEVGINFAWLVLDTTRRMRDADAANEKDRYYSLFEYALQLLLPYMEIELRSMIEDDFKTLQEEIRAIHAAEGVAEQTKSKDVQDLKKDFADAHRYFVFDTLPKASIVKISRDGMIDFKRHDIKEITAIIGQKRGLPSAIKNMATKVQDGVDPNAKDKVEG